MPPNEVPAFEAKYEASVKRGWVQPPKPAVAQ
jgi:hypothetical protein